MATKENIAELCDTFEASLTDNDNKSAMEALDALNKVPGSAPELKSTKMESTFRKLMKKIAPKEIKEAIKKLLLKWKVEKEEPERRSKRESKHVRSYEDETEMKHKIIKRSTKDKAGDNLAIETQLQSIPTRDTLGYLHFADFPTFQPNLTPKEVIQMGSFGGCYFRSAENLKSEESQAPWEEFPNDWIEELDVNKMLASSTYNTDVNRYQARCREDTSNFASAIDPFGWFQWYCRFYMGRRSSDDKRQVNNAMAAMGPNGKWRKDLIKKCLAAAGNKKGEKRKLEDVVDDATIAPSTRQHLQVVLPYISYPLLPFYYLYIIVFTALGI